MCPKVDGKWEVDLVGKWTLTDSGRREVNSPSKDFTRLPPKAKAQMPSGQGTDWPIESPFFFIYV